MRCKTRQNTIFQVIGTTPLEILGPNPRRKSFMLSPLAGVSSSVVVVPVIFTFGSSAKWTVPAGVTQVADMYGWGSGADQGAPGAVLGGGGGGGGAFCSTGPLTVVPGSVYLIDVGLGGGTNDTAVVNPLGTVILQARHGVGGLLDAAGAGGVAAIGSVKHDGGDGFAATGLAGVGGGGGGAGGILTVGGAGAAAVGGAGGTGPALGGFGAGGAGGNGGAVAVTGIGGHIIGGGGGGSGKTGANAQKGARGELVVLYVPAASQQAISLSHRQDVAPGLGILNYIPDQTFPTVISDNEIGDAIGLPWWIVSGVDGVGIQIVEYSYDESE